MTEPNPVTIRRPTEGRTIGIVGDIYRFLVTGEETDGRYRRRRTEPEAVSGSSKWEISVKPLGSPKDGTSKIHRR